MSHQSHDSEYSKAESFLSTSLELGVLGEGVVALPRCLGGNLVNGMSLWLCAWKFLVREFTL